MKQLGMKAQLLGGGAVADTDLLQLAGAAGEGAMAWEPGAPLDRLQQGKAFGEQYQKAFGTAAQTYAPFGYDGAWAAINAMEKANSIDPKAYLPVLRTISFNGVTGRIAFEIRVWLRAQCQPCIR
jgi:branched-chain amino acid transport system substrate-binding protein